MTIYSDKFSHEKLESACRLLFNENKKVSIDKTGTTVEEALKILNTAIQRNENSNQKEYAWDFKKIENLNKKIKTGALRQEMIDAGLDQEKIGNIQDIQIDLPSTWRSHLTLLPRILWVALSEILLLPVAGALCLIAKKNFDPKEANKDQTPILLVHGCGYNQAEWLLFRHQLNQKGYTSVYSLNMDDNIVFPTLTEEQYKERVIKKIDEMIALTGKEKVIVIGHSLGGIVGAHAAQSGKVKAVISIGSPFKGARLLNFLAKYVEPWSRFLGRSLTPVENLLKKKSDALKEIRMKARKLDADGTCKFYHVRSTLDEMVDNRSAFIVSDPRRQTSLDNVGHYGIIVAPKTLHAVDRWLKEIENPFNREK